MNRCKDCKYFKSYPNEDPFQEKYGLCMNGEITRYDQNDFFPSEEFGCILFENKQVSKEEILSDMTTEEITAYLNERLKPMDEVLIVLRKSQVKVL